MSDGGVPLVSIRINDKRCDYCLDCTNVCPSGALTYDKCFEHDTNECWNCESCMDVCEKEAIKIHRQMRLQNDR